MTPTFTPATHSLFNDLTTWQFQEPCESAFIRQLCEGGKWSVAEAEMLTRKAFTAFYAKYPKEKRWREDFLRERFIKIASHEILQLQKQMDKNFGLTEIGFHDLVAALLRDDEAVFEKVFLAQFKSCQAYLVHNYKASSEDAYDATMDTMLEFCKRLKTGRVAYGNLRFLFTRMAGQVYLKWIKKQQKLTGMADLDLPEAPAELDEESYSMLDKAWAGLCQDCKNLLQGFYYEGITLDKMALDLDKSAAAVRKQKQRCIEKLRDFFIRFS